MELPCLPEESSCLNKKKWKQKEQGKDTGIIHAHYFTEYVDPKFDNIKSQMNIDSNSAQNYSQITASCPIKKDQLICAKTHIALAPAGIVPSFELFPL